MCERKFTPEENITFWKMVSVINHGYGEAEISTGVVYPNSPKIYIKDKNMPKLVAYLDEVGIPSNLSSDRRFVSLYIEEVEHSISKWGKHLPKNVTHKYEE